MFLTTEAAVSAIPKEWDDTPTMPVWMGGMWWMGWMPWMM
jgi:hypothetical protein